MKADTMASATLRGAVLALTLSGASSIGAEELKLVLIDTEQRVSFARDAIAAELEAQLAPTGVRADLGRSQGPAFDPERDVAVIVLGSPSRLAALSPMVMGVVRTAEDEVGAVWLFADNVSRTLGIRPGDRKAARLRAPEVGRAVGRVIAHEIAHVLLPDHPHAHAGLMAPRLSGADLRAPSVGLDPRTRVALGGLSQ